MASHDPDVLVDGLAFPEAPRWRDGRLWFSDMFAGEVRTADESGRTELVVAVDDATSGLGFLPNGDLLVVAMRGRRVLRFDGTALTEHADLAGAAPSLCNDMVVDALGRAYVGHFGFDLFAGESPRPASLLLVQPDGAVGVAVEDVVFPNGCVLSPDGRSMVLAETFAQRLTAFDVAEDGSLRNRRVVASFDDGARPDGIALDAEGGVWIASPGTNEALRVLPDGEVVYRVSTGERGCFACALGGADGRSLFLCTASERNPEGALAARTGRIEVRHVDVPGAGLAA